MNKDEISTHYRRLLSEYGDTPQAVQYSSRKTQDRRFQILSEIGNLQNTSILDFGCGTGHLGEFLNKQGINCEYHGTDLVEDFMAICRTKFPKGYFEEISILPIKNFDYIFIGGVFNNLTENNVNFYQEILRKLFSMCRIGLSFNMMSAYVEFRDPGLFYEYPENVFGFIKNEITPFVNIRNDYEIKPGIVPYDFTVYAYRDGQ
jgi:SAM-dependent methyltransferase